MGFVLCGRDSLMECNSFMAIFDDKITSKKVAQGWRNQPCLSGVMYDQHF